MGTSTNASKILLADSSPGLAEVAWFYPPEMLSAGDKFYITRQTQTEVNEVKQKLTALP